MSRDSSCPFLGASAVFSSKNGLEPVCAVGTTVFLFTLQARIFSVKIQETTRNRTCFLESLLLFEQAIEHCQIQTLILLPVCSDSSVMFFLLIVIDSFGPQPITKD